MCRTPLNTNGSENSVDFDRLALHENSFDEGDLGKRSISAVLLNRKTRSTQNDSGSIPEYTEYHFASSSKVELMRCDVIVGMLTSSLDICIIFAWIHNVLLFCTCGHTCVTPYFSSNMDI